MLIQVCASCENSKAVIAAARQLKKQYGAQITLEIVDCLDQCHYPPVVTVNGKLIIWADAVKLNTAVARVMNNDG
jgi:NADH:ubiquinone oxidoreductase subunit E